VRFTVQGYPDDLFDGKIVEIRMNSTTTQNVVTYPVVVSAPNPELKLLPGFTANISFQVGEVKDVVRIPNSSLRFFPQRENVRPEDQKLLESGAGAVDNEDNTEANRSARPSVSSMARRSSASYGRSRSARSSAAMPAATATGFPLSVPAW
jgi:HlyD family secretion protein